MGSDNFASEGQDNRKEAGSFVDPALDVLDLFKEARQSSAESTSSPSRFRDGELSSSIRSDMSGTAYDTTAATAKRDAEKIPSPDYLKLFPDLYLTWKDTLAKDSGFVPSKESGDFTPAAGKLVGKGDALRSTKPADLAKLTGFEPIDNAEVQRLLNTPPGEDLPPIAKKFESYGSSLLQAEEAAEKLRTQIYVSTTGQEKQIPPGATVYNSIQQAVDRAPANSVINVMPGVYKERIELRSNLVLKTDPDDPAIIDNSKRSTGRGSAPFSIGSGVSNVAIKNFEIRNFDASDSGIKVRGSNIQNITLAGNNIHSSRSAEGIGVYGTGSSPISNVRIISNRLHDLSLRGQIEAMPINGNVSGFDVIGNSGYRLKNLFIDVINGEGHGTDGPRGGKIAYNFADRITTVGNPDYNGPSSAGIYSDAGRDLEIYGNYVRNSDFGIELGSEHKGVNSTDVRVHGNIFESSGLSWLKLGYIGNVNNSSVYNNLVVGNNSIERGNVGANVVVKDNKSTGKRGQIDSLPSEIAAVLK